VAQGISFGVVPLPTPGLGGELARRAEALGFDACLFPDTQNLAGDPYSASCLGAHATSRIRLGPGVTNPVTRLPAVTASAIGTVHLESRGRAVLGLGRGDSSAAHAGVPAATTETLESYARTVQAYLRGETVAGPELDSGIGWLTAAGLDKVPLDMACTGPRTIQVAARVADRVSFAVGAAPERLRWALGVAREALAEARRDPEEVQFGAYLNIVADPSLSRARALARTGVGLVAHFSAMKGSRPDALPPQLRPVAERLATSYEMARHGRGDARQSQIVDDAFVDWFAIAGEPAYCVDRLRELSELGLRHVYVIGGAEHEGSLALVDAHELFAEKVMAVLR
jgi:5,10-methylenetetrahydromethanopterin reductase